MLQFLRRPLFFLVALSIFHAWRPVRRNICEASTVSARLTAIDWSQRRKELQRRLLSGVHIASDSIKEKNNYGLAQDESTEEPIGLAGYRRDYAGWNDTIAPQEELKYGFGESFTFQRFQSSASIRKALRSVRSASSFKWFEGKDGRKGYISSTKLGGDYVLAESEQIAVDCKSEDVLRVYLSGELQARWNSKDCLACHFTKCKKNKNYPSHRHTRKPLNLLYGKLAGGIGERGEVQKHESNNDVAKKDCYFYLQDLLLKSQRVIRSQTGPMRYQQIIEIDKVGQDNYAILVRLFKNKKNGKRENNNQPVNQDDLTSGFTTTAKKPFESLEVYVGLEQMGSNVKIYAAGVFEVNRKVVPKIIVFDTSGFAGSIAGKGTLWLAGYFENASMKRSNKKLEESNRN